MARAGNNDAGADQQFTKVHNDTEVPTSARKNDSFATAENVQGCIKYLNQSLEMHGSPTLPMLSGHEAVSMAQACNCIYAMLEQRQSDVAQREAALDQQQRLLSDIRRLEKKVDRCEAQLAAKEVELQTQIGKEHKAAQVFRAQMVKLQAEKDEFQRLAAGAQQVRTQQSYELRKKEKEHARLQEKLSSMLTEKKERSRASIDIVNLLQKEGRTRATWGGKKGDEDFYKMLLDAHETKKHELLAENADLKATLQSLQQEIHALLRDYSEQPPSTPLPGEGSVTESQSGPMFAGNNVFGLPYSVAKEQIEAGLYEGLATIREVMDRAATRAEGQLAERGSAEAGEQQAREPEDEEGLAAEGRRALAQSEAGSPMQTTDMEEASRALEEEREALRKLAARLDQEQQQLDEERRSFAEEQISFSTSLRLWAPALAQHSSLSQVLSPKLLQRLERGSPLGSSERRLSVERREVRPEGAPFQD